MIRTRGKSEKFELSHDNVERRGRPALVLMNIAERIIDKSEKEDLMKKKLTDLQKA